MTEQPASPLTYEQATAALTAPGGFFELATEDVLGEPMQVFANRPRSLRRKYDSRPRNRRVCTSRCRKRRPESAPG